MSIPENRLSTIIMTGHFYPPDDLDNQLLLDYELGGIGLNDTSEGLTYQTWTLRYFPEIGDVVISAPNTPTTVLFTASDISEISLAFDQNMNPFVAFVQNNVAKYWWYDTALGHVTISTLPAGSLSPRCCTDLKWDTTAGISDIILCYVHGGDLKMRMERERYTIEYTLLSPFIHPVYELPAVIKRLGMNKRNRLQWICDLANPIDWCNYRASA